MDKKINDGGPAFPRPPVNFEFSGEEQAGMSLRDYFASQTAGIGATAIADHLESASTTSPIRAVAQAQREALRYAVAAYLLADALLEVRELPREALSLIGLPPALPLISDEEMPF